MLLLQLIFVIIVIHRQKFASGDKVTSFGKEYLCSTCLSREPTPVTELQISVTTSDDDDDDDVKYKMRYGSSMSAPATPAKQDLSLKARTTMTTVVDGSLDVSTRSLMDTHSIDGMSTNQCHIRVWFHVQ